MLVCSVWKRVLLKQIINKWRFAKVLIYLATSISGSFVVVSGGLPVLICTGLSEPFVLQIRADLHFLLATAQGQATYYLRRQDRWCLSLPLRGNLFSMSDVVFPPSAHVSSTIKSTCWASYCPTQIPPFLLAYPQPTLPSPLSAFDTHCLLGCLL